MTKIFYIFYDFGHFVYSFTHQNIGFTEYRISTNNVLIYQNTYDAELFLPNNEI